MTMVCAALSNEYSYVMFQLISSSIWIQKTDKRVQAVTDCTSFFSLTLLLYNLCTILLLALNVLRMIKLFAWEPYMLRRLSKHREDELRKIRTNNILDATMDNLNMLLPAIAKITTFATYVRGALRHIYTVLSCKSDLLRYEGLSDQRRPLV